MYTPGQRKFIYAVAALTVMFAGVVIYLEMRGGGEAETMGQNEAQDAGPYWKLPDFELTDQDGKTVGLAELKGKVWLADFIYTTCPGQCPLITAHVARLQHALPVDVRLVSFSTDPVNDTPGVLKAYGARYGAGEQWTFLTGDKAKMYGLIKNGFKLAIDAPPGAEIIHSTKLMLVDKTGTVRGFYEGTTNDADGQIAADAKKLLGE